MEITLVQRSVYDLPSKQRVGAIVFDGAADMQIWPGPGPERELAEHYGDRLQAALDSELRQVEGQRLSMGSVIRVSPGRLHCNFLAWVATRPPEPGTDRAPAPDADTLRLAVMSALRFAAKRSVERVAFPALGGGPSELPRPERLAVIARASRDYHQECIDTGRAPVVEEVFVCEPSGPAFREAKRRVAGLVRSVERELSVREREDKQTARRKLATKSRKASGTGRSSSSSSSSSSKVRSKKPKITAEEVVGARGSAERYSMKSTYKEGDYFVHPKFGVGKVAALPAPGQVLCVFEDGSERKLVHGRS